MSDRESPSADRSRVDGTPGKDAASDGPGDPPPALELAATWAWLPALVGMMVGARATVWWPAVVGQVALLASAALLAVQLYYVAAYWDTAQDRGVVLVRWRHSSAPGLLLAAGVDAVVVVVLLAWAAGL
jgi:hypothetical protein